MLEGAGSAGEQAAEVVLGVGLLAPAPAEHRGGQHAADAAAGRFEMADLRAASAIGADFSSARFVDADLRAADLRGADFTHADLRRADLRGADLRGAVLEGADLSGALQGKQSAEEFNTPAGLY